MRRRIKAVILSELILALLSGRVSAQTRAKVQIASGAKHSVVVSLPDRRMALLENGSVKNVYPVAVGKTSTPSPVGTFTIVSRLSNPTYSHRGIVVSPGPNSPVGTRWMGLSIKGYGIHGTNAPTSIGKAASHGCIRMAKGDLEELFDAIRTGDQVEIVGERNAETAELFGSGEPASVAAAVEAASAEEIAPVNAKSMSVAVAGAPLGQ